MYDVSKINILKIKMSSYLNTLSLHVHLAFTKRSYIDNSKYLEANAQAMIVLKKTLSNVYLSKVSNCDSAFLV